MYKVVLLTANHITKEGDIYTDNCLKNIARKNPEKFTYDDKTKELFVIVPSAELRSAIRETIYE